MNRLVDPSKVTRRDFIRTAGMITGAVAALPLSDHPVGKIRMTLDTRAVYQWNGSAWVILTPVAALLVASGASCSGMPTGALALDNVAFDLHVCKPSGLWTRVYP